MGAIFAVLALVSTALLGASMPFSPGIRDPNTQPGEEFTNPQACRPSINTSRIIKVDVDPSLQHLYTGANPANDPANGRDFDKTDDEWILVKENAPIPAWKVALITHSRGDKDVAEMERIGTAVSVSSANEDEGSDVYIGTGWCNPNTGDSFDYGADQPYDYCLDPLVQDVVFVLTRQGATDDSEGFVTSFDWPLEEDPDPPKTIENLEKYFWTFNVYYKADKLPANPSISDLPCWIEQQCYEDLSISEAIHAIRRRDKAVTPDCEVIDIVSNQSEQSDYIALNSSDQTGEVLQASTDDQRPRLIIKQTFMNITNPPSGITLYPDYISGQKLSVGPEPGRDELIGTAYENHFNVYLRRGTISGTSADHALILDPTLSGHPDGPFWLYVPLLKDSKPNANSLQLGSFVPGIPSFFYEWWTPSCKPALYLYPEQETELTVQVIPNGYITESIPKHGQNGWHVIAHPDGSVYTKYEIPHTKYDYLYYEASIKNVAIPHDTGWVKMTDQLPVFFADVLPKLGLNEKESQDFLDYWLPKLQIEGTRWFITLIDEDEVNRVEPVSFSVQPEYFHRIRFYFENIDHKIASPITTYELPDTNYERNGFTVIDWGGIMGNGSCGLDEVSQ
ncbi:hypothetical protein HY469_00455 [Candidatus Roizmanbacteria bacterium]|nr:hypothetical protein [Candidatus Roizmanbacteria bacterium]